MIHTCPGCGQKNRVPEKYTGIPVCAACKTQMFETQMRAGKPETVATETVRKRSRWSRLDWNLAIPILMLSVPIYWALNHDWLWLFEQSLDWITAITVNVAIVSAIALAWLIIAIALKVSWEEAWGSWRNRTRHPPGTPLIDLGPWEAAQDFINRARQWARRFALRKDSQ